MNWDCNQVKWKAKAKQKPNIKQKKSAMWYSYYLMQ